MHKLTIKQRGLERSTLVVRGQTTVAEVFTDREPGDQYQTAALIAAAPELLAALQDLTVRYERLLMDTRSTKRAEKEMAELLPRYTEQARAAIARATGADHA